MTFLVISVAIGIYEEGTLKESEVVNLVAFHKCSCPGVLQTLRHLKEMGLIKGKVANTIIRSEKGTYYMGVY